MNEEISAEIVEEKKEFKILGIGIWRVIAYFIIYSVVGYIIETVFGLLTKGVIESRQSFIWGPFCAIYGLGAVAAILCLNKVKDNKISIFIGGAVVGSVVEYVVSLIGEYMYHIKWWDYSGYPLNIEGRICILFTIFWGLLSIFLINMINPIVDKLIDKLSKKSLKIIDIVLIVFLAVDCMVGAFGIKVFFSRLVYNYNLELNIGTEKQLFDYEDVSKVPWLKNISDNYFTDERMLKTFPNIKLTDKNGDIILVRDILSDIKPYYFQVFKIGIKQK